MRVTDRNSRLRLYLCSSVFICGSLALALPAQAEVTVKDAWVRGTVPAQKSTGAFMTFTASEETRIVGVSSPAANNTELHISKMEGGVMAMEAVDSVTLPAGKPFAFKPGGHHVMLLGLKAPLKTGQKVPIRFEVEERGRRKSFEVQAEVRALAR